MSFFRIETILDEVNKDGEIYKCTYSVETPKGNKLKYSVNFENIDNARNEQGELLFYADDVKLLTPIEIGKLDKRIAKNNIDGEYNGKIYTMAQDPDSMGKIQTFEEYQNSQSEIEYKVLDYVKGKFTNSKYDEYLVIFAETNTISGGFVSLVKCFIVYDDSVINEYDIYDGYSIFFQGVPHYNLRRDKNFGFLYSIGWINDFNQNGKNEIYIATIPTLGEPEFRVVEFSDDDYFNVTYFLLEDNDPSFSFDWFEKKLYLNVVSSYQDLEKEYDKTRKYTYQWAENLGEYVLVSVIIL